MLDIDLNKENSTLVLKPNNALTKKDFDKITKLVDPYIEEKGKLNGIIIYVEVFPWWDSFSALLSHFKFIKNHHQKVSNIALVTNSVVADFAEHIASHFINAKIKHFDYDKLEDAKNWILTDK